MKNLAEVVISKELKMVADIFAERGHGWDLIVNKNKDGKIDLENLIVKTETGCILVAYDYDDPSWHFKIEDIRSEDQFYRFPTLKEVRWCIETVLILITDN